ncbi:MAG: NAD(P)H-dependent oxidoreductase subunit E, partial [Vicinamibacteria bacterium]|nr:NAD(P)H-dependent oxidoreductase subunit E [Vicinamibacteria bacterium]
MIEFDQQTRARFEELRASYPQSRSALLGALRLLQEHTGHITSEGIEYVAALLDLTPAQVQSSASFYSMFRFHPEGRRQIEVCTNLACQLRGADEVLAGLCRGLGLEPGETTADGSASVHRVECLAACGGAPAVQVNGRFVEGVSL